MKAQEIERVDFAELNLDSERENLGLRAANSLGYRKLHLETSQSLLSTLKELGYEPLVPLQVANYKASKTKTGAWSGWKNGLWSSLAAVPCAAVTISLVYYLNRLDPKGHDLEGVGAILGMIISGIAAAIFVVKAFGFFFATGEKRGTRKVWSWKKIAISYYEGTIPEFALMKAVAIKEKNPNVSIYVDQLMLSHQDAGKNAWEIARDLDPFLVVNLGNETYHIDVWDEKEYEKVL